MKRLYLNLNNHTATNLDTLETTTYDNFYDRIMDKNEATTIYIYDLSYYWRYIIKEFTDNKMECVQFDGKLKTLPKNSFTITTSFRQREVVKIKAKGNQAKDHNTNIIDAKNLLGSATIEEVMSSTEIDNEDEAVAFFLSYLLEEGHTSNTLSANAFKSLLKFMYPKATNPNKAFEKDFPMTTELDEFCRRSYHGGFCYLKPECLNLHLQAPGFTLDVNSLFPSVMEQQWLPCGVPVRYEGKYVQDKKKPAYIQEVEIFDLQLKENGIPCIKQETTDSAYFEANKLYPYVNLVLNNIDLQLLIENYDFLSIDYIGGYKFTVKKRMFEEFIDHWKTQKIEGRADGDKLKEKIAKLMLNSCYGKFGSKVDRVPAKIKVSKTGNIMKLPVLDEISHSKCYYVPLASFITSYGKKQLVDAIKANYDRFIYADTDSIHLIGTEPANGIVEDNMKFGAWKVERNWTEGRFISLKKYAELDENGWTVKCAGLPVDIIEEVEQDIELFQLGQEFEYTDVIINKFGKEEEVIRTFTLEEQSLERI